MNGTVRPVPFILRGLGHILVMFTPAGFEGIILELNEWARAGKQPTREELVTQADHYGIHFV